MRACIGDEVRSTRSGMYAYKTKKKKKIERAKEKQGERPPPQKQYAYDVKTSRQAHGSRRTVPSLASRPFPFPTISPCFRYARATATLSCVYRCSHRLSGPCGRITERATGRQIVCVWRL